MEMKNIRPQIRSLAQFKCLANVIIQFLIKLLKFDKKNKKQVYFCLFYSCF